MKYEALKRRASLEIARQRKIVFCCGRQKPAILSGGVPSERKAYQGVIGNIKTGLTPVAPADRNPVRRMDPQGLDNYTGNALITINNCSYYTGQDGADWSGNREPGTAVR